MHADVELDCRGLSCPLPILRTKKSLARIDSGQILSIIARDPGSLKDFKALANQTGNERLDSSRAVGVYRFVLRKK